MGYSRTNGKTRRVIRDDDIERWSRPWNLLQDWLQGQCEWG